MKKLMSMVLILLIGSSILPIACGGVSSNSDGSNTIGTKVAIDSGFYTNLSSAELFQMLQNKDFILVDVDPMPTKAIPNTDLFIPIQEVIQDLSVVSQDKEAKIVVYCAVGVSSSAVAAEFTRNGYTNIFNLSNGIVEWEQQGYAVVNP